MADQGQDTAVDQPLPVPQNDQGTYTVNVNGTPVHFASAPSHSDIDAAASHLQQQATAFTDPNTGQNNATTAGGSARQFIDDLNDAAHSTVADIAHMGEGVLNKVGTWIHGDDDGSLARDHAAMQDWYKNQKANSTPAVPPPSTLGDVINSPDPGFAAARFAGSTVGSLAPYAAAYTLGGAIPGALTLGATAADKAGVDTDYKNPQAMAAAGVLNTGLGLLPVPFARTGSPLWGALGGAGVGAAQGATSNVVPYLEGKTDSAAPSLDQILTGTAVGAPFGALAGAAHGEKAPEADPTKPVDVTAADEAGVAAAKARADGAVADRVNDKAGATDTKVSASTSNSILDDVHGDIASEINGLKTQIGDSINPSLATSLDDLTDRAGVNATLKDGVNKVKGDVNENDIQQLLNRPTGNGDETLGDTQEGRQLADLLRQSQSLSELARGSQLGGLAKYTSLINPLSNILPGGDRSPFAMLRDLPLKGGLSFLSPDAGMTAVGADLAARGIGAIGSKTGLWAGNSKLGNFLQANSGVTPPIDMEGARSIAADNYQASLDAQNLQALQARTTNAMQQQRQGAALQAQANNSFAQAQQAYEAPIKAQQQDALKSQKSWDTMQAQQQQAVAQQQGQQASDARASQKAWDAYNTSQAQDQQAGLDTTLRHARASQKAWDAYDAQRLSDARRSQKSYEGWLGTQQTATARFEKSAQEAEDLNQAQRLRAARLQYNDPGSAGFDRYVYDQTGLKPQEAMDAVGKLRDQGVVSQEQHSAWIGNPKALMKNNQGPMITDILRAGADKGDFAGRDPAWSPGQAASNIGSLRMASYEAAARGNQARVTDAVDRVQNHPELSPAAKTVIAGAADTIGNTSNKQDATAVRDAALSNPSLSMHEAVVAHQELSPLIDQIRHNTPQEAAGATLRDPTTVKAVNDAATNMSHGDYSDLGADAPLLKGYEQAFRSQGMTELDARLHAIMMMKQWVDAGRPGNGN